MTIPERHLADTRSGKKICAYPCDEVEHITKNTEEFSMSDHFDAACAFDFLTIRALRRYGRLSEEFALMDFMREFHVRSLGSEDTATEKKSLGLITSIDLSKHGAGLVKDFLRE